MTDRTLNEARQMETERLVNGELWQVVTAGYASLVTLGTNEFFNDLKG